ncbi:xanthine dehydrogenase [Heliobacterium gestii]|uniref:Xanthine dehydrogenase n=1 Tax=Heliomicrobium gestii TaxID=2699 RepID=A0A845LD34_HELGE|nr:XdhC/CoxI family protein [Heliomicrobium gestii]MBM7866962.1 xanthine dehydrogenase accessory factor [Heliomicrobium gestii]MZP42385.1 xanthine dehydrogenase [Heliomicrobium gestii]
MVYVEVVQSLEQEEPCVVITLLKEKGNRLPAVVGKLFWSPTGKMEADTGERERERGSWDSASGEAPFPGPISSEADALAEASIHSGKIETKQVILEGERAQLLAEPFFPPDELVILGGGHVSQALVPMAVMLGYRVTVVDDRPAFAAPERFPGATRVICDDFARAITGLTWHPRCAATIITRGHRHDLCCLEALVEKRLGYLGMIGSRRRVHLIRDHLRALDISQERIDQVHMPIGLAIGAQTPEEIAVSIAAELIQSRRGGGGGAGIPQQEMELLRRLAASAVRGIPAVVATVIATRGSTPRKAGAKLLVFRDGQMCGTIGGGCIEAEARREALQLFDGGRKYGLFRFSLDDDQAAEEGMACGGTMEVLLERVAAD